MKEEESNKLEIKFSYLEDTIYKLNKIVSAQELELVAIKNKMEELTEKMEDLDIENRPNRKPPHY